MNFTSSKRWPIHVLAATMMLTTAAPAAAEIKNVILMIADGSGYNSWNAASMYQGKWNAGSKKSTQVYDGTGWVAYGCCTFSLNMSKMPTKTGAQDPALVYDPVKAWDRQQGYEWLKTHYTDSAAAATALSTGLKTFNHAINWNDQDQLLGPTMCEAAKANGKCVGVITTVPWSHATPAGLSNAHTPNRDAYSDIARQMLEGGVMDVIMGTGNPDFDNNGHPFQQRPVKDRAARPPAGKGVTAKSPAAKSDKGPVEAAKTNPATAQSAKPEKVYKYVNGAQTWKAIEDARVRPSGTYQGFRPVSTRAEFEALMNGPTPPKVVGTAQVGETLQQSREIKDASDPANDTPLNTNLPDLAIMSRAALNVLNNNHKGLFLMIEGGAVDWANHRNQPGRMIQEQVDFVRAVEAVQQWVDAHSNWQETLVILTADHETGLLWGPESDTNPFDPIVDHGAGQMPGMKYHSKNHSNSLVPLYARGAGSKLLAGLIAGQDPVRGPYIDNTSVAKVLLNAAAGLPISAPAAKPKVAPDPSVIPSSQRRRLRRPAA